MSLRQDFAIWDSCSASKNSWSTPCSSDGKGSSQPMGRFCSRFGGEGSGSHCERAVDLFKGREYSFHVEVSERNSSGTGWHASIIDEFSGNESEIGTLFVHADPKAPAPAGSTIGGYGGLTTAVCSTCQHVRNRTEPTDPQPYGGISFMEYFLGVSHIIL